MFTIVVDLSLWELKMVTPLIVCSAFNEKDSIKRHLISIPQYIHQATYDGRYKDFDHPSDLSDDGTREVVDLFFNTYLIDAGGLTEVEKRQRYFDEFNYKEYDFLIVVDADEYFNGDWQEFLFELDEIYEKYQNNKGIPICFEIQVFDPPNDTYSF